MWFVPVKVVHSVENRAPSGPLPSLTFQDGVGGDGQAGVHQRGLLLPTPRPAGAPRLGLLVGLHHQGLLPLPPLLLLQQRPLVGGRDGAGLREGSG